MYLRLRPQSTCFCACVCHATHSSWSRSTGLHTRNLEHVLIHFRLKCLKKKVMGLFIFECMETNQILVIYWGLVQMKWFMDIRELVQARFLNFHFKSPQDEASLRFTSQMCRVMRQRNLQGLHKTFLYSRCSGF